MGKIVVVKPGNTAVKLPSGNFNQSEQTTLTDAEYAALGTTALNALTVVASGVAEPARSPANPVSLIDAVNQSIVLGNSTFSLATTTFLPNHAYKANQFVKYNGLFYAATIDFTSGTSFNVSNWTAVGGGTPDPTVMHYRGLYSAGTYAVGDVVLHGGQLWTPIAAIPGSSATVIGSAAGNESNGATLPSGCQVGDVLIAGAASFNVTNMTSNGWQQILHSSSFTDAFSIAYYVLTSADITNGITPSWGSTGDTTTIGLVIRGITASSVVTALAAAGAANGPTPSVTPTLDSWLIEFVGTQSSVNPVISGPALSQSYGLPSGHMTAGIAYEVAPAGTPTTSRNISGTTGYQSLVVPITLPSQFLASQWSPLGVVDGVLASTLTAKGDLLVASGSDAVTRLPVGTNGQVLAADSTQTVGVKWAAANNITPNTQTGTTYTPVLGDAGLVVEMNNAAANTLTVPPNSSVAFPIGTVIKVCQLGAGTTTIAAGAGVTIQAVGGTLTTSGQYATVALRQRAANVWVLSSSS